MPVRLRVAPPRRGRPDLPSSRKWRNWQTHQLEGLAVAIPWGFESPLSHQSLASLVLGCSRGASSFSGFAAPRFALRARVHSPSTLTDYARSGAQGGPRALPRRGSPFERESTLLPPSLTTLVLALKGGPALPRRGSPFERRVHSGAARTPSLRSAGLSASRPPSLRSAGVGGTSLRVARPTPGWRMLAHTLLADAHPPTGATNDDPSTARP